MADLEIVKTLSNALVLVAGQQQYKLYCMWFVIADMHYNKQTHVFDILTCIIFLFSIYSCILSYHFNKHRRSHTGKQNKQAHTAFFLCCKL